MPSNEVSTPTALAESPAPHGQQRPATHGANPTSETYDGLSGAYRFFNERLFEGLLPAPLVTLQRKKRVRGYYHEGIFISRTRKDEKVLIDELAMNPEKFAGRTDIEILSTLVHEMVHCRQAKQGRPSRTGYHNAEWAQMMDEVGLAPSSTGQDGGKRTGQSVTHYIVPGGRYDQAATELIAGGWRLEWQDVRGLPNGNPSIVAVTSAGLSLIATPTKPGAPAPTVALTLVDSTSSGKGEPSSPPSSPDDSEGADQRTDPWDLDELPETLRAIAVPTSPAPIPADEPNASDPAEVPTTQTVLYRSRQLQIKASQIRWLNTKPAKSGKRTKYTCPLCESSVWGREGLNIVCEDDDSLFVPDDPNWKPKAKLQPN